MQDPNENKSRSPEEVFREADRQARLEERLPNRKERRAEAAIKGERKPGVAQSLLRPATAPKIDARVNGRTLPMQGQYGEAFCLMKYRDEETLHTEWCWNSRDGITPFGIKNAEMEMKHVDWHEDVFVPNFIPPIGMRIFMDQLGYNPQVHGDFNLRVVIVDQGIHDAFKEQAQFRPWKRDSRLFMPRSFA